MEKKEGKSQSEGVVFSHRHGVVFHTVFDFLYSTRINGFCHVVAPPKNESFIGQSTKMSCNYLLATEIKILRQKVMFSRVFLCLLSKFVILFFLAKNHITHGFLVLVEEQRCGSLLERARFFFLGKEFSKIAHNFMNCQKICSHLIILAHKTKN